MTRLQDHILELLTEFDEICHNVGVRYSLVDKTLLYAESGKGLRGYEVDVAMAYQDYRLFQEAVERRNAPNRFIESLTNNPDMPGWYFRYVDTSSTLFSYDYAHARHVHGLGINIHIPRKVDSSLRSLGLRFIEQGMKSGIHFSYKRFQIGRPYNPLALLAVRFMRVSWGPNGIPDSLAAAFERSALDDVEGASLLSLPEAPIAMLPKGFLSETGKVTLGGFRFDASELASSYLAERFFPAKGNPLADVAAQLIGSVRQSLPFGLVRDASDLDTASDDWRLANPLFRNVDNLNIYTSEVPYGEFMPEMYDLLHDQGFWRARESWLRNWVMSLGWRLYLQRRRWDTMLFVAERYRLWEMYAPYKDAIEKLFDAGCYDVLWLYLENYRRQVDKYLKKGYPVVCARWLWELSAFLQEVNGDLQQAQELYTALANDKLGEIHGPEADAFLAAHHATGNEAVSKLAAIADTLSGQSSAAVLIIDQADATGSMAAFLAYCLRSSEWAGYRFAYTVSSLEEAVHITDIAGDQAGRVRFVVRDCFEFGACLEEAALVVTTEMLPVSFVKRAGQHVVFAPNPSFMFFESYRARQLLQDIVPTLAKVDVLVLPDQALEEALTPWLPKGCSHQPCVLRCEYPSLPLSTGGNETFAAHTRLAISLMNRVNWNMWNSFEDVREFARTTASAINCLSREVRVRIPQSAYEAFLTVDEPADGVTVGAFQGLLESIGEAPLLITDNLMDLAMACHAKVPTIYITASEKTTELLQDYALPRVSIARTMDEALRRAAALLSEGLPTPAHTEAVTGNAAGIIADTALGLLSTATETALPAAADEAILEAVDAKSTPADLLVLEWEDTDDFHAFLPHAAELASTVLLLEKHEHLLLDSDIEALRNARLCMVGNTFGFVDGELVDEMRCEREWRRLFDTERFDVAIVPSQLEGALGVLIGSVPATEVVSYRALAELTRCATRSA